MILSRQPVRWHVAEFHQDVDGSDSKQDEGEEEVLLAVDRNADQYSFPWVASSDVLAEYFCNLPRCIHRTAFK